MRAYSCFLQLFLSELTVSFLCHSAGQYSRDSKMEARSEMTQDLFYPLHVHLMQFIISLSVP